MDEESEEDQRGWDEACRREAAISDLIRRYPKRRTMGAVDSVAWELGLSRATIYRLIERYRAARTVSALVRQGRGRKRGTHV